MVLPTTQLLVYSFGPEARFEGQLVGALERIESGGTLRIVDALFVGNDPETGEVVAVDLHADGIGGALTQVLDFRLDRGERRRITERLLGTGDARANALRGLADALRPGTGLFAVIVEHAWMRTVGEAVTRTGGQPVVNEFVDSAKISDLSPKLSDAARQGDLR